MKHALVIMQIPVPDFKIEIHFPIRKHEKRTNKISLFIVP